MSDPLRSSESLASREPGHEDGVWVVLDSEGLPEMVYCREDTAREYADDPNENKAGEGPFTVARFVRAASALRLDGKPDSRDADGLISGDPLRRDGGELAMLRELATVARDYFDEKNRPAVSWDGMPSVQEQQRRRAHIVDLLASAASFSVIPTTVGEEPDELSLAKRALEATGWGGIYDDFRDVPDAIEQMASHIKSLSGEIPTGLPDGSESRPIDFSGEF